MPSDGSDLVVCGWPYSATIAGGFMDRIEKIRCIKKQFGEHAEYHTWAVIYDKVVFVNQDDCVMFSLMY